MNIKVNGVKLYYEEYGEGKPIILSHGNGDTGDIFDLLAQELAKDFKVYVIDSRGHGKSEKGADISYELMAEDVLQFMEVLDIQKPIFYGYSDGGIIGLTAAIKSPDKFSQLIISGANIFPSGLKGYFLFYCKIRYFFAREKSVLMMITEPQISPKELADITIPVHLLAGAFDIVKKKHTKLMADNLPNATVKILPWETHGSYVVHSKKLYDLMREYI